MKDIFKSYVGQKVIVTHGDGHYRVAAHTSGYHIVKEVGDDCVIFEQLPIPNIGHRIPNRLAIPYALISFEYDEGETA